MVFLTPVSLALCMVIWLFLAVNLRDLVRRHALRIHPYAVSALKMDGANNVMLCLHDQGWYPCEILSQCVYPGCVILRVASKHRQRSLDIIITADAVAEQPFRHLRTRLNLRTVAG